MAEVEIPYIGGPLGFAEERELREDWELADGADGSTEGYVFDYRPRTLHVDADPNEVHRYVLTKRRGRWEFIYEPDLADYPPVEASRASSVPTDEEVYALADLIADARIKGVFTGGSAMARMILAAGYRKVGP